MKNQRFLAGFFLLAAVTAVVAVGGDWRHPKETYEAKFTFIAPKKWNRVIAGVEEGDQEFHTNTKYILYSQDDEKNQAEAIQYALLTGTDGIITAGMTESRETEAMIQKAQEFNIPVVFVDSDLKGSLRDCYIGSNNYEVGRLAGEALAEAANGKARVGVIVSYKNNSNQKERVQGFQDAVSSYPEIQVDVILEGRSSALLLRKEIPRMLAENPDIDALVCAEGVSIHYCSQILRNSQLDGKGYCIVGMDYFQDIVPDIQSGFYSAVVRQNQRQMGYEAVKYLKALSEGKERGETVFYTDIEVLNQENVTPDTEKLQEDVEWYVF